MSWEDSAKKRDELQQQAESAEDTASHEQAEKDLKVVLERIGVLKSYIRDNDQHRPVKLTEATIRLDKSFHDVRYYKAIEAGTHPCIAWVDEKKPRRATLFRMKTSAERAAKRQELENRWMEEFRSGTATEGDYQDGDTEQVDIPGMETEVLLPGTSSGSVRVAHGAKATAKKRVRGHSPRPNSKVFARNFARTSSSCSTVPKMPRGQDGQTLRTQEEKRSSRKGSARKEEQQERERVKERAEVRKRPRKGRD